MRQIGYGVIGLGFFGEKHAEMLAALPNVALRAVCTRQDRRRREIEERLVVPAAYRLTPLAAMPGSSAGTEFAPGSPMRQGD